MRFTSLVFLSGLSTLVSAHFRLQYPEPRGVFVADQEPTFCDGYNTAASNRSEFPLSGGFVSIDAHHPKYTIGVLVSTAQNPSSFDNFTTAVNFFPFEGTGPLCFPIDLNSTGVDGIRDGANVTLQVVFDGGDGNLYQCSDVTLSNNFATPSNVSCTNTTNTAETSSSDAPAPTNTTGTSSATTVSGFSVAALLSVVGAAMSLL
ncbi:unnamed protein product [Somion occarium]|uniref:Copper acquisition factor BIM1-like domain-containing protein n=1 Tax=Somion occarium TaxID=3059160 RepID=A0ABP1CLH5_9APHY